ncbi:hypothetical protein WDL1P1_00448 (plasmid) [Variovorax sp. WDL1]|nr:hypothetical protein E5P1_00449 [Variovorax sp. PBL-E5]VTV17515.1 hypothetical protein WDL1P1_00448 [Variovorax sp. WDL1]
MQSKLQVARGLCAPASSGKPIPTQRWRDGKSSFRVDRDEGFRKGDFAVDLITEGVARKFVEAHHYSRSFVASVVRVGLFGPKAELMGVAVFSVPMNQRVIPKYCSVPPSEGLELGRLVLLDAAPYCSETYFLGRAFDLLKKVKPAMKAVVSYSDPVPRRDEDGGLTMPGHVGICYQAFNGRYLGRGTPRTHHVTASGRVVSPRSLSKIRLLESGHEAAERALVHLGAPARPFGQEPAQWLDGVLRSGLLRPVKHPGNHVYAWPLGRTGEKAIVMSGFQPPQPYPKQSDSHRRVALIPST